MYLLDDADLIRSELPAELDVPPTSADVFTLYAVLMRAKGDQVTASDVHDAWAAWMLTQRKRHDAFVPYEDLSPAKQHLDDPYVTAIRRAARRRQAAQ